MNPMTLLFSAAAAMSDFGRCSLFTHGPRQPRHFGNTYYLSSELYGRAKDGSIRLRKGKANSRADDRREVGLIRRAGQLCRMGRITRAELEGRADRQQGCRELHRVRGDGVRQDGHS